MSQRLPTCDELISEYRFDRNPATDNIPYVTRPPASILTMVAPSSSFVDTCQSENAHCGEHEGGHASAGRRQSHRASCRGRQSRRGQSRDHQSLRGKSDHRGKNGRHGRSGRPGRRSDHQRKARSPNMGRPNPTRPRWPQPEHSKALQTRSIHRASNMRRRVRVNNNIRVQ